ncbi:hypothetical protein GTA08_BOTSDO01169 [Neofusicoccum parvum]|uniref:Uncharacterized protein n=1 Tax=Neofusicoccum parvum TaxID=310453 RepID=A0ACB5SE24_9PEZI|nr:hypothetical protein GTA08_BOTSDO01169 [Neofusicoccum parvum]
MLTVPRTSSAKVLFYKIQNVDAFDQNSITITSIPQDWNNAWTHNCDSQDREHAPVYYQDDSLNIWKADRENSSTAWTRKQVNMAGINPKKGTPLTAFGLPEDTVSATHQPLPHAGT